MCLESLLSKTVESMLTLTDTNRELLDIIEDMAVFEDVSMLGIGKNSDKT